MKKTIGTLLVLGGLAALLAQTGCASSAPEPQTNLEQAREVMSAMAVPAQAPPTDWIVVPLEAAQKLAMGFESVASNDSTRVRQWSDGESFEVFFEDTDGSHWQAVVVNRDLNQFVENHTHTLIWDRPTANEDGTPLVDFDGEYMLQLVADFDLFDTSADSVVAKVQIPHVDRLTARVRAIDANGNVSAWSNVLVVRQGVR